MELKIDETNDLLQRLATEVFPTILSSFESLELRIARLEERIPEIENLRSKDEMEVRELEKVADEEAVKVETTGDEISKLGVRRVSISVGKVSDNLDASQVFCCKFLGSYYIQEQQPFMKFGTQIELNYKFPYKKISYLSPVDNYFFYHEDLKPRLNSYLSMFDFLRMDTPKDIFLYSALDTQHYELVVEQYTSHDIPAINFTNDKEIARRFVLYYIFKWRRRVSDRDILKSCPYVKGWIESDTIEWDLILVKAIFLFGVYESPKEYIFKLIEDADESILKYPSMGRNYDTFFKVFRYILELERYFKPTTSEVIVIFNKLVTTFTFEVSVLKRYFPWFAEFQRFTNLSDRKLYTHELKLNGYTLPQQWKPFLTSTTEEYERTASKIKQEFPTVLQLIEDEHIIARAKEYQSIYNRKWDWQGPEKMFYLKFTTERITVPVPCLQYEILQYFNLVPAIVLFVVVELAPQFPDWSLKVIKRKLIELSYDILYDDEVSDQVVAQVSQYLHELDYLSYLEGSVNIEEKLFQILGNIVVTNYVIVVKYVDAIQNS